VAGAYQGENLTNVYSLFGSQPYFALARSSQRQSQLAAKAHSNSYGFVWGIRSWMVAEMRAAGVHQLQVNPNDNVEMPTRAFPDQCSWLYRLQKGPKETVRAFSRRIGYGGPVESLTMMLCILCSPNMRQYSPSDIASASATIRAVRLRMRAELPYEAHPVQILREAFE
jgi:hypothetical protein